MKSAGEYSLMWANNHINGLTWAELVDEIQHDAVADYLGVTREDHFARKDKGCTHPADEVRFPLGGAVVGGAHE